MGEHALIKSNNAARRCEPIVAVECHLGRNWAGARASRGGLPDASTEFARFAGTTRNDLATLRTHQ
jgi:hypothetical protein